MANKKNTKKYLNDIMSDLFTATIIAAANEKADADKVADTQEKIFKVYNDFNSRLSNYERKNAKLFFKQYKEEINKEIESLINDINNI